MKTPKLSFEELLLSVLETAPKLINNGPLYKLVDIMAKQTVHDLPFKENKSQPVSTGIIGDLIFPYQKLGAIDSLDLFGLDELILFSFYWTNRNRYKKVADLGANIGLHSIFLAKCGFDVTAYEPDPLHCEIFKKNLDLNGIENVILKERAISDKSGNLEFIRVLGNTTSSHLTGAKDNPYGELNKINVKVDALKDVISDCDFVKMDIEGIESQAICSLTSMDWGSLEMMLEVGSEKSAYAIFEHCKEIGLNMFPQKKGWELAQEISDIPISYLEGSLFLTKESTINWKNNGESKD